MRLLIWVSILMFLASCQFNDQEVDLDIGDRESRIVLNAILSPDDSIWLFVTRSMPFDEFSVTDYLNNAVIDLRINGSPEDIVLHSSMNLYFSDFVPSEYDRFEITVAHPVLQTVRSEVTIPASPELISARAGGTSYDLEGLAYSIVRVKLVDEVGVKNHYLINIGESYIISNLSWITSLDGGGVIFNDAAFEDREVEIELLKRGGFSGGDFTEILKLSAISESYFEYIHTREAHLVNRSPGLFSGEPIPVYSNVENGFGIFGAYASSEVEISPEE